MNLFSGSGSPRFSAPARRVSSLTAALVLAAALGTPLLVAIASRALGGAPEFGASVREAALFVFCGNAGLVAGLMFAELAFRFGILSVALTQAAVRRVRGDRRREPIADLSRRAAAVMHAPMLLVALIFGVAAAAAFVDFRFGAAFTASEITDADRAVAAALAGLGVLVSAGAVFMFSPRHSDPGHWLAAPGARRSAA